MIRLHTLAIVIIICVTLAASAREQPSSYDLVVANGRVMDPESGLDAVRHIGIRAGTIEAVSETPLRGGRVIDASRHVVSPGFIDLHEHGQQEESYRMMVRDGVTSAFELEVGTRDVAAWYAARGAGQIVNYGVSVGHIPVRMQVLGDPGKGLLPAGVGGSGTATDAQMAAMEAILREGLAQGAVAVGFGSAYTPGAPMSEIERMFRIAAEGGVPAHIHMRGGLKGLQETIAAAAAARAALHIVHVNSSAGVEIDGFLTAIKAARDAGQDVTTEAYPYGAGMTEIQSALFDDWRTWPDARFGLHQLVSTGERLTRATFGKAREAGGTVITHGRSEEQTRAAISSPLAMIASDGFIENGRGHPRTSGTFAKVLGKYVRHDKVMPLMGALRRMTLDPARRLERRAPAMVKKGRVKAGADADLTIFDPTTVIDRATYEDATIPSAGIPYVIVGGQIVVDAGNLTAARPGRAIRAPLAAGTGAPAAVAQAPAAVVQAPAIDWDKQKKETLAHYRALVQLDTSNPPGNETKAVEYLRKVLEAEGIPTRAFALDPQRANLVARLKGNGSKRPLLILAHTDVVGVQREKWPVDPFGAVLKDGYVWGRGSVDDKPILAANLMVMLLLKRSAVPLDRDVIFLAESGEEADVTGVGINFMVARHFEEIDAEFALTEGGSATLTDGRVTAVNLGTAEKLPARVRLVANGTSGHGSVPRLDNALVHLSAAVHKLGTWETPMRLNDTTRTYFEKLALVSPPDQAARYRDLLNPQLAAPAQSYLRDHEPRHYSMLRTSVVPTVLKAGVGPNVIPSEAEATLDIRALPDEDVAKFYEEMKRVIGDPAVTIVPMRAARPASPASRLDTDLYRVLERVSLRMYPAATVLPSMSTGASDMAQLRAKGVQSYGIGPAASADDRTNFGAHSDVERLLESSLYKFVEFTWYAVTEVAARQ